MATITIDFETYGIEPYPNFPPQPVGVSIKYSGKDSRYYAWGHPTGNNCTKRQASRHLKKAWDSGVELVFQNGKFDMAVLMEFFPEVTQEWGDPLRIHDTMFLIFMDDPHQTSFSLKPAAWRILGMPPEEQEEVRQWLVDQGITLSTNKKWGAHISQAPGDLVGKYANGDTLRTEALFNKLMPSILERHMGKAYDRERRLVPLLLEAEKQGVRCDVTRLAQDVQAYSAELKRATADCVKLLGQEGNREFNIDSGAQLAEAARASGLTLGDDEWPRTATGRLSTSRDNLRKVITDKRLFELLAYRGALATCLNTFMIPWLTKATATGGWLHPSWNQVKGDDYGAKTGRLSSSDPNFQNIPTEFHEAVPEGYLPLPIMRIYVLPDEGEVIVSADFHSQEIRMLGHFAEGAIKAIYDRDPAADVHQVAADIITDTLGIPITRKATKVIAFSILYGAGITITAERLGCDNSHASLVKRTYLNTLEGVKEFMDEVDYYARSRIPIYTWGGRELYAPPSVMRNDGSTWNKDYVLLNHLIQGSSADQTKQAIIDYCRTKKRGRFLMTVHDEIVISVPKRYLKSECLILKAAMEAGKFDVPMRATLKQGPNWFEMEDYL